MPPKWSVGRARRRAIDRRRCATRRRSTADAAAPELGEPSAAAASSLRDRDRSARRGRPVARKVRRDGLPDALGRAGDAARSCRRSSHSLCRDRHVRRRRWSWTSAAARRTASAGDRSPVIARCTFRHSASSHCGYAANRGGMIIVCSVSASSCHRSRVRGSSAASARMAASALARHGIAPRRASPSCASNDVR